jgi:NAD(P)-dependent dehydrogenase (short-subunit alcohol dehydrogenase family)/acyl carrier protein
VPFSFRSDSSYLIAGGLRGVGKAIAQWMVSRGARNLILVSRSGVQSPETRAFVKRLNHGGCQVIADACDIADENSLRRLLDTCKSMPPIRGCIQSAMVLRVSYRWARYCLPFANAIVPQDKSILKMTHEDWIAAIRPKVSGSWNLHTLLPPELDFFVMLSSITGVIGNHGQANYAAGNTFQDQLARHRVSKGLRATSLDLSAISDVGWIAENSNMGTLLRGAAIQPLKQEDIFTLLQYACNPVNIPIPDAMAGSDDESSEDRSQIIAGLDNAAAIRRKGLQKPAYLDHALFSNISVDHAGADDTPAGDGRGVNLATELFTCNSLSNATELIVDAMKLKLTDLVSAPAEDIDDNRTFSSYGVDSLVAVEFRSWLGEEVGADIAVLEIIGTRSIRSIAGKVATVSTYVTVKPEEGARQEE